MTTRSGESNGSGSNSTPCTTLKMAAFRPTPSPSVAMMTAVEAGVRRSMRPACAISPARPATPRRCPTVSDDASSPRRHATVAKHYRFRYSFVVLTSYRRRLREFAHDNHGYVTTADAATLGVPPDSPDLRLGRAANERDIKALDLGAYRYVHFATHGILAGDVPYINQPALVLSQTADLGGEDGFLTMSEVLKLPLRAEMVVLSACQTALGREVTGEGVVGLTRAFLYAGSRAAVVSLWPVDDASTALFMGRFYEHVKAGQPPARALARAKQDLRAEARYAHVWTVVGGHIAAFDQFIDTLAVAQARM